MIEANAAAETDVGLTAGRYEIRAELGRGGMGAVCLAFDHIRGAEVALKTLERTDPVPKMLFEREYRVLSSLQHPRVIGVHDYGILDGDRRYYTMEVLPGDDLMQLAPLSWREACRHLRDVATCLALLHARGLVHRDVSPRNVRFDTDGHAKLIDFGALAEFGVQSEVVGTPACMAPEVVRGQSLDARTDLFSLGAVAYWALTGERAYQPANVHAVEAALLTAPPPPSQLDDSIPKALDQLVMSMLAHDPMERPANAAEVIERLSAIADLEEGPLADLARSHLLSATLVGREREQTQLRERLARTHRGQGSSLLLSGARGSGRSRLLEELVVEGRLAGIATLRIDALAHPGVFGMVRGLTRALLEAAPLEAREELPPYLEVLYQEDPSLPACAKLSAPAHRVAPSSPAERRAQTQNALAGWILAVAKRRPLLLLVDDVHELDTTFAGCLVLLAHQSRHHPIMLVTTRSDEGNPPAAVAQLEKLSVRFDLGPLDPQSTDALLASAFGDVPYRIRLSGWLHAVGQGNPSHMFILLNELILRQIIRYEGGAWVLPSELSEVDLPQSLLGILAEQVAQLQPVVRSLAQMFALHRGSLSVQACIQLLPEHSEADVAAAIQQLVGRNILVQVGAEYRIAEDAIRELLLDGLERHRVQALHRALGDALREIHRDIIEKVLAGGEDQLDTDSLLIALRIGWYLADGEEFRVGHKVLRNVAVALTVRGDGLVEAIPSLEAALRGYRERGRTRFEAAPLLMPLALAGTYANWQLTQRYGSESIARLCEVTGISLARRWSRWLGRGPALVVAIAVAMVLYRFTGRRRMMPTFRHGFLGLMGIGTALVSSYIIVENRQRAREVFDQLRPLGWFPSNHPIRLIYKLQQALVENAEGAYPRSSAHAHAVLARLGDPNGLTGFPDAARLQLQVGAALLAGQMDSLRTDGRVQQSIEVLQNVATSVSRQARASVHAAHHAHRGERLKYAIHQGKLDLLAAQAGATWREDITGARRLWGTFALCEDLMALKRLHRTFDTLVVDLPSLRRVGGAIHAAYLAERGMHAHALSKYEATFEQAIQDPNTISLLYASVYARLLRHVGRAERALKVCVGVLARISPEDREFDVAAMGPQIELGLALVATGRLDEARTHALDLLAAQQHDNPFLHGLAHKLVAQVALASREREVFVEHLAAMAHWFRTTENPALVSQCHRLAEEGRSGGLLVMEAAAAERDRGAERLREAFRNCQSPAECLETALSTILEASGAEQGYLYLRTDDDLEYAAPLVGTAPPDELRQRLSSILLTQDARDQQAGPQEPDLPPEFEDDGEATALLATGYETIQLASWPDARPFRAMPLYAGEGPNQSCIGIVALLEDDAPLETPNPYLVGEVVRGIQSTAEVRTVFLGSQIA